MDLNGIQVRMLSPKSILEAWSDYSCFIDKETGIIQDQSLVSPPAPLLTFHFS